MRWLLRGFVVVLLVVAAAVGWVVSGLGRGPNVTGTLQFSALSEPVEVLRDGNGIPYIFANNLPDLIRAQGFVTAQSRIFQMEAYRALAFGRLAEAIGEAGLPNDREMRLLGLARNAERHARLLSPQARDFLSWYAEGMNAYIHEHADDLPVELKLAGFRADTWTLEDMVGVMHFVYWSQAANYKAELLTQQLIDRLGPERAAELFPVNHNPDRTQPLPALAAAGAQRLGLAPERHTGLLAAAPAPIALGSNNWAIGPEKSASGAAVVVNDPHLDARMLPGIWFPIGLFSPEVSAVGAALPATPGLIVGRNQRVAFGVTNSYGDSQDLFIERIAPGQPDHYVDGDRIRPFEIREETLRIKDDTAEGGFREETMTIRHTVRGPIISEQPLGPNGDRLLSLRLAAAEVTGTEIGLDRLLVAHSAADVDAAVQQMDVFYFNYVFGDKDGVIGHRATGRVPVRRSGQGLYPKEVTGEDDWMGFIPPSEMPGQLAPARGWVATANHDNRPDGYPYDYSSFFSPSYRYERIGQVLEAGNGMDVADQVRLMRDTHNLQVRHLKPAILDALQGVPEHADFVAILTAWDNRDQADQTAPLIYQALYQQIAYETFIDELGAELADAWLKNWYTWQGRFDQLIAIPASAWFDDVRTPEVETLPDIIRRAAAKVREDLTAKHGADPAKWRWGDAHRLQFDSPVRRSGFGRDWAGRAAQPYDGSGETVQRARYAFGESYDVQFFASLRLVADLADDEKLLAVVSGGVVERQFHPHQKNQLDPWFAGELLPWWFDRDAIEANAKQRQRLVPAR